jgi:two-component system sensor histidine kinase KdpD
VSVRIAPDLPLARGDEVLVEQVLSNLVENALKYTPPHTAVEIDATVADPWIVIGVRDYGPGLAPGEEELVFEKFYRGSDEQAQSGTGLGLAICRAIVEAHGGGIHARNDANGGVRFSFTIPIDFERSTPHGY